MVPRDRPQVLSDLKNLSRPYDTSTGSLKSAKINFCAEQKSCRKSKKVYLKKIISPTLDKAKLRQFSPFLQQINKSEPFPFSSIQTRAPSLFPFVRYPNLHKSKTPIKIVDIFVHRASFLTVLVCVNTNKACPRWISQSSVLP